MKKIIIAEDEILLRDLIVESINRHTPQDVIVETVSNGRDLVDKVRRERYILILTDNKMPEMTGLEAIRKIREFNKEVPIYMRASLTNELEKEARKYGANGFIPKPGGMTEMIEVLTKYSE